METQIAVRAADPFLESAQFVSLPSLILSVFICVHLWLNPFHFEYLITRRSQRSF